MQRTQTFDGFREGQRYYGLPAQFYAEVLPAIDNLAELKLTLYCFWAIWQAEGEFRYLTYNSLANSAELRQSLQVIDPKADYHTLLDEALARAVGRQTLLRAVIEPPSGRKTLYIINTETGRRAAEQLRQDNYRETDIHDIELLPERPNIFQIFEQEMGQTITPHLRDELIDAEAEYTTQWVIDAMREAVASNARTWRYALKILKTWQEKGRNHREKTGQNSESDRDFDPSAYDDFFDA
jgi:DNA replication protein